MYAVVETGGKQYRVAEGDIITVEKLDGEVGNNVELGKVLLVAKDGQVQVGKPLVEGAKVVARVLRHDKAKKILVFHYKAKKNIRKRYGHRQPFTRLQVEKIEA
ncbi:MAG: 50S ribosomal protein L21 [Firmicutes bacterium]|nr:50S ribosomal protein L21 [Bacillota bacterium]